MITIPIDLDKIKKAYEEDLEKVQGLKKEIELIAERYDLLNFTYSTKNIKRLKDLATEDELMVINSFNKIQSAVQKYKSLISYIIHYDEDYGGTYPSFDYTVKSNGCITLLGVQLPSLQPEFVKSIMDYSTIRQTIYKTEIVFECYYININKDTGKSYDYPGFGRMDSTKYFQIENKVYCFRTRPTKDANLNNLIRELKVQAEIEGYEYSNEDEQFYTSRLNNHIEREKECNKEIEGLTKIYSEVVAVLQAY